MGCSRECGIFLKLGDLSNRKTLSGLRGMKINKTE